MLDIRTLCLVYVKKSRFRSSGLIVSRHSLSDLLRRILALLSHI